MYNTGVGLPSPKVKTPSKERLLFLVTLWNAFPRRGASQRAYLDLKLPDRSLSPVPQYLLPSIMSFCPVSCDALAIMQSCGKSNQAENLSIIGIFFSQICELMECAPLPRSASANTSSSGSISYSDRSLLFWYSSICHKRVF